MPRHALVIGTGLGGLSTALRLSKMGYRVTIVEKYSQAGGRLNELKLGGYTFDMGPSFFSMTYEFKAFEQEVGIKLPFEFVELDPLYSVNIAGNERTYKIYKDLKRLAAEFESVEPMFEEKMRKYLDSAGKLFLHTYNSVVRRNYDSRLQYLASLTGVPMGHAPKMIRSVWQELGRYFDSEEVKQIFSLVAFFLGATPFDTPAVYCLLNYTELIHDGYHNVKGGMYRIVEAFLSELRKRNVTIHYQTEITGFKLKGGKLVGFTDANGLLWEADVFVVNADAASFRGSVLKRKAFREERLDNMKWTLAPLTIYLGVKGEIPNIEHHNYFLGNNFRDYAARIFKNKIKLEKPYYYVNVLSKFNANSAPEGCESVFILCPVPDLRYKPDWSDTDEIVDHIIQDLSERTGYPIAANLEQKAVLNPVDWASMFNLYRGSGLGLAHDLNQIGGFRPKNHDEDFENLFYAGASTVPGTGLPMVMISGKLAAERILKRYGPVS